MKKWHYFILGIITIIVLVVGGFIVLLFAANKDEVVTSQSGDSGVAKTIPLTRSMDVKEWNITMKTSELVDPGYTLTDENTLMFSSGTQKMLSNGCSFKNQTAGPWGVKRYKSSDTHPNNLVSAGNYVYEFIAPTKGCENYKGIVESINNSYHTMYLTIKTL